MKIGFDLDNVFIDLPPFIPDYIFDKAYKRRSHGFLEYRIPRKPEQAFRNLLHYPKFRQPIKENITFLKTLVHDKNELYLISSRYGFLKKRTDELVKKYELDKLFTKMYFNFENQQPHHFKNSILQKLQLDCYVDDDIALLKYLAKQQKKTVLYWLNPKQSGKLTRNLFAIRNLSEMRIQ